MAEAMAWLIGDADSVKFDRTTSYHGPELVMIEAVSSNKKRALASFSRLGTQNLDQLVESMDQRLDDNHVLHIRLDLNALVAGQAVLSSASANRTVKGQIKFEVYPGKPVRDQIQSAIQEAKALAAAMEEKTRTETP